MENFWNKPEKLFVIICLFWGLLFIIINPPFQASDEDSHLYKIYGFTQGSLNFKKLTLDKIYNTSLKEKITVVGNNLPAGLVKASRINKKLIQNSKTKTTLSETFEIINTPLYKDYPVFIGYAVPNYLPPAYVPNIFVIWILALIGAPPFLMLFLARLGSLITYIVLTYYSIKITPIAKQLFLVIALLPMAVYQAGSLSIDALTIGLAFLICAYALNLIFNPKVEKITKKQKVLFAAMVLYMTFCKFTYAPLMFLFLVIPNDKFYDKKEKLSYTLKLLFLSIFVIALQTIITLLTYKGISSVASNISSFDRLIYIFAHPIQLLWMIVKSIFINFKFYLNGFVGLFGWSDTYLPPFFVYLYTIFLFITSVFNTDNACVQIDKKVKSVLLLIFISSLLLSFTIFAILFLPEPKTQTIVAFQGRYLIALAPVFFLLFYNCRWKFKTNLYKYVTIFLVNLILLISAVSIVLRFYA